ncbi:MAG: hypothetical protein ACJ74Q_10565 [Pyrinomonadaceae bacterium]
MPSMNNNSALGDGLGKLAGAGIGAGFKFLQSRSPDLKPQPGGNPLGDLAQKGGGKKFLGLFGRGGTLRRPGDAALVGDDPERGLPPNEMVVNEGGGKTEVIPLKFLQRYGAQDGQQPAPTAPSQPPPAQSPFSGLRPDSTVPQVENDPFKARLQETVQMPPGYSGEGAPSAAGESTTRARISEPQKFWRHRLDEIESEPVNVNTNSRAGGALRSAGRLASRAVRETGNPWAGVGAAIGGGLVGLADKTLDERLGEEDDAEKIRGRLARMDAREVEGLKLEDARAGVRLKNAQAGYAEARPDIEAGKAAERAHKAEVARIFGILRSLNGQKLDPENNRRHAKLIADADAAGIPVDAESFNDSKGNVIRYTRTDEANPSQTVEVERNVVTGEETILGQRGFQATRGTDGRTTAEVKADDDRDAGRAETHRHNLVGEGQGAQRIAQGQERIGISRQGLTLRQAAQDNRFDAATQKRFDAADKLAAQSEEYERIADGIERNREYDFKDPATGETVHVDSKKRAIERDKNLAKAAELRRELFASHRDAFTTDAEGHVLMTTADFKALFPSLAAKSGDGRDARLGEALRLGINLTDGPGAVPDASNYTPSPIHRPARRGASSATPAPAAGKTHVTRADARRLYPQLKGASDADVDAAIRAGGFEPIP